MAYDLPCELDCLLRSTPILSEYSQDFCLGFGMTHNGKEAFNLYMSLFRSNELMDILVLSEKGLCQ